MTETNPPVVYRDGHYYLPGHGGEHENSFTCYVAFRLDGKPYASLDEALEDVTGDTGSGSVEEVDVRASSASHAREVCEHALRASYDPGGMIIEVRFNEVGMIYL